MRSASDTRVRKEMVQAAARIVAVEGVDDDLHMVRFSISNLTKDMLLYAN